MKKIFFLTAMAVMVLASCSKENGADNIPQEGAKATLSIKMAFLGTYADVNATPAESTVNTVDVFIFEATTGPDYGSLVTHVTLAASDFTPSGNVYESNTDIVTTSGARKVGVGINLPAAIVTEITTQANINAVNDQTVHDVTRALIATSGNFVMFNTDMPTVTLVDDVTANSSDNIVTMNIERMAGKAALATSASYTTPSSLGGTFNSLEYRLMQTNKQSYLMREASNPRKDPNYISLDFTTLTPSGSQYDASVFEYTEDEDYINVEATSLYSDHILRPAFYGAENTADFYQQGTTTYFLVRAQFTPDQYTDGLGASAGSGSPGEFWLVTNGAQTHFCSNQNDAVDLAGTLGEATITKHVGGYCYWAVWIGNENSREFLRNNYYLGQINAITGFGKGSEPDVIVPPIGPVDGDKATIECNFTILPWNFNLADPVVLP